MIDTFRIIGKMFISTKEAINLILSYPNKVAGFGIGVLGCYAFPFLSLVIKIFMSKSDRTDVIHTLVIDPFLSATLFVGAVIFVFSVSRLFRGKGSLLAFAITSGWGGIYNIASAILLVPVFPISQSMGNQTPGSPAYMILALLALLSILGVVFATFRLIAFQVRVISRICELRVGVAIFVFIATAIPIFIIYDKVF